jgi:hypothetical protein
VEGFPAGLSKIVVQKIVLYNKNRFKGIIFCKK